MPTIDITPKTSFLDSLSHLYHWPTILGEFIDNAFDAGSMQVKVTLDQKNIAISDNGNGCDDLVKMLKLGDRGQQPTSLIGYYGVGFVMAAISTGNLLEVRTIAKGKINSTILRWSSVKEHSNWSDIPIHEPRDTNEPSGTYIRIGELRTKTGVTHQQFVDLCKLLSEQYAPGIRQGRQIVMSRGKKTITLGATELPSLDHARNVEIIVGKKRATLLAGLLTEGESYGPSGITVTYAFRTIEHGKHWGLGDDPTPGLVGWLDLGEGWRLSTNKTRVSDSDIKELSNEIHRHCVDLIDLAVVRGYSIPLKHVGSLITTAFEKTLSDPSQRKGRRKPGPGGQGRTDPTGEGKPHRKFISDQPVTGIIRELGVKSGFRMAVAHLGKAGRLFTYQQGGIVEINVDNPAVSVRQDDLQWLATNGIYAVVAHIILHEAKDKRKARWWNKAKDSYEAFANLAADVIANLPQSTDAPIPNTIHEEVTTSMLR